MAHKFNPTEDSHKMLIRVIELITETPLLDTVSSLVETTIKSTTQFENPQSKKKYNVINDNNAINMYDGIFKENMTFTALEYNYTPLHLACRVGNCEIVKRIIHFTDTNLVNHQTMPIHVAVMNNHSHIVQLILDKMYAKYDQYNSQRKGVFQHFYHSRQVLLWGTIRNHRRPTHHLQN